MPTIHRGLSTGEYVNVGVPCLVYQLCNEHAKAMRKIDTAWNKQKTTEDGNHVVGNTTGLENPNCTAKCCKHLVLKNTQIYSWVMSPQKKHQSKLQDVAGGQYFHMCVCVP